MLKGSHLASFFAGAITVLAFAPFDLFFIPYFSLAFLFYQWRDALPGQAAKSGYLFGLGLMGFGVFWLHVSIAKFGGVIFPMAVLLALVFAAVIACYYAAAGWLSAWLVRRFRLAGNIQLLVIFPAIFVLSEILRAYFLGGFPWLAAGYSQLDTPLLGLAPLMGVFAVSWLTAVLAAMLLLLVFASVRQRLAALVVAALLVTLVYLLGQIPWSHPIGDRLTVRIVQGNIPQELKWQPANLKSTIDLYTSLSFSRPADLVVWPETAIPAFAHAVEDTILQPLQERLSVNGSQLVVGIPIRAEDHGYFNSMLALGQQRDQYDKRHLVPFGEFAPLDFLLRPLVDYFRIPMSDFREGEAEKPLLRVGEHQVGVSICYEDAFGDESAQALPEAAYLINVSNDAWFGDSLAPYQHLQIARMRAVETGRYMIRATNTGISALIDPQGKVLEQTGQAETAVIHSEFQPMTGMTLYAWVKDWLITLLMLMGVAAAVIYSVAIRSRQD